MQLGLRQWITSLPTASPCTGQRLAGDPSCVEGALDETSDGQMWQAASDSDEYMIIDVGSSDFFVACSQLCS